MAFLEGGGDPQIRSRHTRGGIRNFFRFSVAAIFYSHGYKEHCVWTWPVLSWERGSLGSYLNAEKEGPLVSYLNAEKEGPLGFYLNGEKEGPLGFYLNSEKGIPWVLFKCWERGVPQVLSKCWEKGNYQNVLWWSLVGMLHCTWSCVEGGGCVRGVEGIC